MDEQWRPAGQNPRGIMGFSRKGTKILEKLLVFRGRVPKSSVNYGFSEEGCCVKDIVHERPRLSAVVQCSGVCEATALAQRSGGQ